MNRINRRQLLKRGSAGVAALAAAARWDARLWANPLGLPIGLELYTVRDQCERDFPGTLQKVAQIGYQEVEMFDFYNHKASEIREALKDAGLKCPAAHYKVPQIQSGWEKQIEYAKEVGLHYMVSAWLDPSVRKDLDDYKRLADLFNQAGEQCKKAGLQFAHHNHNFEFKTFGDVVAFDELLRLTDPHLVQFEMDCFWVTRAGKDSVEYFKKYPGRIAQLHIKDIKRGYVPSTDQDLQPGPFAEVGRGVINWKRIFAAAPRAGVKHYYVEQDFCDKSPFESIKVSYDYLKNLKV